MYTHITIYYQITMLVKNLRTRVTNVMVKLEKIYKYVHIFYIKIYSCHIIFTFLWQLYYIQVFDLTKTIKHHFIHKWFGMG